MKADDFLADVPSADDFLGEPDPRKPRRDRIRSPYVAADNPANPIEAAAISPSGGSVLQDLQMPAPTFDQHRRGVAKTSAIVAKSPLSLPRAQRPERDMQSVARDILSILGNTGVQAIKPVVDVANIPMGGALDPVAKEVANLGRNYNKFASPTTKYDRETLGNIQEGSTLEKAAHLITHPGLALNMGAPSIGSMLFPLGATKLAALAAPRTALALGDKFATGAAVGANSLMNAGDTFGQTEADLPGRLLAALGSGASSALVGKATGGGLEGQLARGGGVPTLRAAGAGILKESAQEFGENVGNQFAQDTGEGKPLNVGKAMDEGTIGALLAPFVSGPVNLAQVAGSPQRHDANLLARAIEGDSNSMPARPDVIDNGVRAQPAPVAERPVTPTRPAPTAQPVPEQKTQDNQGPSGIYRIVDAISADGPTSEIVKVIVRPDGTGALQRDNGDVIDITNMLRAGFSVERALAQSLGDDTSGKNVSRAGENQGPSPAVPQLPYDPTVQNPQRPVVVDQQGNARSMSADEFLAADETRQGAQDLGLTPDVRRAQETRSTPAEPDPIPSDLLQRLRDTGWTPPVEGNNPNPDPAQVDAIGQDLETLYQQDVKDGIKQRLGMDQPPAKGEDKPQSSAFRSFLRGLGIAPELAGDLTGERGFKANNRLPGTFRKGGLQLDEIVTRAVERGFLTDAQVQSTLDNGGTNALVDMIRAELRGELQVSNEVAGDQAQQQMDSQALEVLHRQAEAIGFDTTGLEGDQINLALKRIERRRARVKQFDAKREAKAERQAMTDAQDLSSLDDSDIPWDNDSNVSAEDAMRSLGFSQQEIDDAIAERPAAAQEDRSGDGAPGQDAAGPAQGTPAADQGSAPGQQGQAQPAVGESQTNYTSEPAGDFSLTSTPYEKDLFSDSPAQQPTRINRPAEPERAPVRGDAQPEPGLQDTPSTEGEYFTNTIIGSEVTRQLGASRITSPEHAATATQYLYKSAVERLDAIVTDKDGKPLAVVGGFKGALAQASVYPATIVGEAVRIPGAASIWFSHNHPSGSSTLSRADENLNKTLADVFQGSGIEPKGLLAVTGHTFSFVGTRSGDPVISGRAIAAPSSMVKVPVIERQLGDGSPGTTLSSPLHAKQVGKRFYDQANSPGLMLLNSQNQVTAWVPIPLEMMGALRYSGQLKAIYRAVSQANAGAAVIVHGGELDSKIGSTGVTASENIAAALKKVDVQPLDTINAKTDESAAEKGKDIARGPMYSRPATKPTGPTTDTLRTALTDRFGKLIDKMEARGFLKLWPSTQAFNDGQQSEKIEGPVQGYWDGKTAHLFADGIEPGLEVAVLLHEVGEHASMEDMLGPNRYQKLVDRAYDLVEQGDKTAMRAMDRIPDDTPDHYKDSEFLAYMIETVASDGAKAAPSARKWLDDIVAAIRAWFSQTGFNKTLDRFGQGIKLTPQDIAALAVRAVRWQAERGGVDGAGGQSSKAQDQTQTAAFKAWFGDSKVVDGDGKPLVVYHGTHREFSAFDAAAPSSHIPLPGFYFTPDPDIASTFAESGAKMAENRAGRPFEPIGANVMPAYLSLQSPMDVDASDGVMKGFVSEKIIKEIILEAKRKGHDGVILRGWRDGSGPIQYIAFDNTQIKSATGNRGTFDPTNPDIRFSRTSTATGTQSAWDAPLPSSFDDVVYKMQDKHIDTKRVVDAITAKVGQIKDAVNVYLQEELFHGRAAKRVADFGAMELKPVLNQMRMAGLSLDDVEEFLHARHAKEANALIAQREPGMPDGGSGMTNQAADDYMKSLTADQKRRLEAVASKVDAIIGKTRQMYADYGLEDQKTVDGWGTMFANYVPLMREGKDGGMMGIGQGFTVKGKEVKGRTGSTRKVVDILANIAAQREKVIVRGEKNRVATALVGLAAANPNKEFWETRSQPPTERVYDAKSDSVVDRPDSMFKQRPNVVTAKVKDSRGNVTEQSVVFNEDDPRAMRMAAALKNLDAGQLEGLLGVSAKITRYFSAINTQYNPVFGVVNLVRDVQGAMVNLGSTELAGQQAKIAKNTLPALAGIYKDVRAARQGKQPTSKWSALWDQMQEDGGTTGYRELFSTTADRANSLKNIIDPNAWADGKWGKVFTANGKLKVPLSIAKQKAGVLFDWLSDYNEAMENGVRLAAYSAALDKGMTRAQAASLSKNLTVNFNRKGQVGQQAGALYAFFNAAMQGTARIGQVLFEMDGGDYKTIRLSSTGKKVIAGGLALGSIQAMMLAAAGFGDDEPPDFVRERSLVIPTGGKGYISIPMPLGLHVIPGLGRHATEFALNGFKDPAKRAISIFGMLADAFNPIGNAGLSMQTLAPTALDPLVALTENKDWTGKPIARTSSNKAVPGHSQWKDTASSPAKWISEAINTMSGGDKYVAGALSPTPDQIDYLFAQVTGGVGRELAKVEQTAGSFIKGEELPTYKVPLVGRFYGNAGSQASEGTAFYASVNKLNEIETKAKAMRKDGKFNEAAEYLRSQPDAPLILRANAAERQIQKLKRDKRDLIEKGADREQVRAKEEQITAVMANMNRAVEARRALAKQ